MLLHSIFIRRRSEFWVALVTALMVVFIGVEQGILLAIVLSLIVHTRRGYRPKNAVLVPADSGVWHPQPVLSKAQALKGLMMLYRFTHSLYYANAQLLSEEITYLTNVAEPPFRWFCIDASAIDDIDYTASETLRSVHEILKAKQIRLVLAHVLDIVNEENHNELRQLLGKEAFYDSSHDVINAYQQQTNQQIDLAFVPQTMK